MFEQQPVFRYQSEIDKLKKIFSNVAPDKTIMTYLDTVIDFLSRHPDVSKGELLAQFSYLSDREKTHIAIGYAVWNQSEKVRSQTGHILSTVDASAKEKIYQLVWDYVRTCTVALSNQPGIEEAHLRYMVSCSANAIIEEVQKIKLQRVALADYFEERYQPDFDSASTRLEEWGISFFGDELA